jgi:hypothetical protein
MSVRPDQTSGEIVSGRVTKKIYQLKRPNSAASTTMMEAAAVR